MFREDHVDIPQIFAPSSDRQRFRCFFLCDALASWSESKRGQLASSQTTPAESDGLHY